MDFMIVWKWTHDFTADHSMYAPFIINIMINFLIKGGAVCDGEVPAGIQNWLFLGCDEE